MAEATSPWYLTSEESTPAYTVEPTPRETPRIEVNPWYYSDDNKEALPITNSAEPVQNSIEPWWQSAMRMNPIAFAVGNQLKYNSIVKGVVEDAQTMTTNIGRAAAGEYLTPEEETKTAVATATTVGMPSLATAPLRKGSLGTFGASPARVIEEGYFGQQALERAQRLESKGVSQDDILKATGFFKDDVSGKWMFEISDHMANLLPKTLKINEIYKLNDVFKHDELFKYYPELKDIKFKVRPDFGPGVPATARARFVKNENLIEVKPDVFEDSKGLISTILHESQHVIQKIEGLPSGSQPIWAGRAALFKINKELEDTFKLMQKTDDSEEYGRLVQRANRLAALEDSVAAVEDEFGRYLYARSPGEIQARLVQERMEMTPEQRQWLSPRAHLKLIQEDPSVGSLWKPSKVLFDLENPGMSYSK